MCIEKNIPEQKQKKMQRFYNVDFLRFISALGIVMFHGRTLKLSYLSQFAHLNVIVEFFFIMGGFFLFKSIKPSDDTCNFAKKKLIRLVPVFAFLMIITLVTSLFIKGMDFNLNDELLRIFFLQHLGFSPKTGMRGMTVGWFAIVFFWVSLFYFYINKLFEKKYLNLIIWLLIIFSYGIYYNCVGFKTGGHTNNVLYCCNIGVLRALGGMGLGYFLLMLYDSKFLQKCSRFVQIVITVLEIYCLGFLINYLLFTSKIPGKSPFTYVVIFSVLFYLFLVKQGFVSKIFDNKFFAFGGKYSYSMYIMHPYILNLFFYLLVIPHKNFVYQHVNVLYPVEILVAVIFSICIYYLVEKPATKYLSEKFLKK